MNITNKLKRKIDIYKASFIEDSLGAMSKQYTKYKSIYSQVLPITNKIVDQNKENEILDSSYKFIIRKKSLPDISQDMLINFNAMMYSIDYYNIDFKNNEYVEIFSRLVVDYEY